MKNRPGHGLVLPQKIETREEGAEHVLGAADVIIHETGDWTDLLPDREPQSKYGVETNGCTGYATYSALETLVFKLTGQKVNYADRTLLRSAVQAGILDPSIGADPHKMAEHIRNVVGAVAEELDPWHEGLTTKEKYYDPTGLADLLKKGPVWCTEWEFTHKWVWTGNPTPQEKRRLLKEALKKGPVCVSVYAWKKRDGKYYKPKGATDNHWTMLAGIKKNEDKVFDSYDTYLKDLEPNYDYSVAKVYYLTPKSHLFHINLYYGQTHEDVPKLQRTLIKLGFKIPSGLTHFFGEETRNALRLFQAEVGIKDDGSHFGPKTRYEINKATGAGKGITLFIQGLFAGLWRY